MGVEQIHVTDPFEQPEEFGRLLKKALASNNLTLIIARRPCLLAASRIKQYERAARETECSAVVQSGGLA